MNSKMLLIPITFSILMNACGKSDKKDEPSPSVVPPAIVDPVVKPQPIESVHLSIADFSDKCEKLVAAYNADGAGQAITVSYMDWNGNDRTTTITTKAESFTCVPGKGASLVVSTTSGTLEFAYALQAQETGKLQFSTLVTTCVSKGEPAYIQTLKDNGWLVNETVREAVERMFREQFCPSFDAAIQTKVGSISQAVQ